MADKEPQFIVTDRRKFTTEGDLREGASWTPEEPADTSAIPAQTVATEPASQADQPSTGPRLVTPAQTTEPVDEEVNDGSEEGGPPPTAEEAAEQHVAYQQTSRVLEQTPAGCKPRHESHRGGQLRAVGSIRSISAIVQMGGAAKPGEQPRVDIVGARQNIDILGILANKTKGNLTHRESHLLQNALFDLRMMFLELTNAIAAQATVPPKGKK